VQRLTDGVNSWSSPTFTPDGQTLIALYTPRTDKAYNEARLAAMGEPDELAQYNAYLTSLAAKDTERNK